VLVPVQEGVYMEYNSNDPLVAAYLKKLGVGSDLSIEHRVQILQQKFAELLAALQKAGVNTGI
jgi:hypothetical protein